MRFRWPRFSLRLRLLAALLAVSSVTLGAAAIALLSPLEHRLRHDATQTMVAAAIAARPAFADQLAEPPRRSRAAIADLIRSLARRTAAEAAVVDAGRQVLVQTATDKPYDLSAAAEALRRERTVRMVHDGEAHVAVPVRAGGKLYVVALRKQLTDVTSAVRVVRQAFLPAAGLGLLIAAILAFGLASRLSRRLKRLRDTAGRLEAGDFPAPVQIDRGRDEIGELSRAFGSMQAQLERQESARRSFVATASHELRTPLASLQGMLELLDEDLSAESVDLADARAQSAQAHEQSQRLAHLATDLLDLSRLDAKTPLREEAVELSELCRAVAAEFSIKAEDEGRTISLAVPADGAWATGDPGAVARIVRILLDNALRFAQPPAQITVVVRNGGRPGVEVADTGPGIPRDERSLVFERFRRGSSAGTSSGFGLGLAIGAELAARMGGSLELADSAIGARFVLSLVPSPERGQAASPAQRVLTEH